MPPYSPLLAVASGVMEFAAAVFALLSPGRKRILLPTALLLLLLAGYQFAEVAVCASPEVTLFSRLAYFDITWLPPLSLLLMTRLVAPRPKGLSLLYVPWFAAAGLFAVWIFAAGGGPDKSVCEMVIARYSSPRPFEIAYGSYFQSGLTVLLFGTTAALGGASDPVLRKHLAGLQAGALGFILPSLAVRIAFREMEGTLPSVMCHFALVLAVFLVLLVLRERRYDAARLR
ncbi:MAG: hypothetical protein JW742_05510 [Candidatus Aminicenantes bacterium]|nr:hypothetical protein [Candidatus Aminicenantes bacterium]